MFGNASQGVKLGFFFGIGGVLALMVWGLGARALGKGLGG